MRLISICPAIGEAYYGQDAQYDGTQPSYTDRGDGYGDTDAGERIIDSQMASSTLYVSGTNQTKDRTMFGVNFADGRIKGYGTLLRGQDKLFYIMYVRGNTGYGVNDFTDNGDGTVTDASTGLMWSQADSGDAMNWADALAWVQQKNSENYLGHNDWRLPNVKELQNIVDYTRSPDTSNSAAIDPVFQVTEIVNEAGQPDYPAYWSATTHINQTNTPGSHASYVTSVAQWVTWTAGLTCVAQAHSDRIPRLATQRIILKALVSREMQSAS